MAAAVNTGILESARLIRRQRDLRCEHGAASAVPGLDDVDREHLGAHQFLAVRRDPAHDAQRLSSLRGIKMCMTDLFECRGRLR